MHSLVGSIQSSPEKVVSGWTLALQYIPCNKAVFLFL